MFWRPRRSERLDWVCGPRRGCDARSVIILRASNELVTVLQLNDFARFHLEKISGNRLRKKQKLKAEIIQVLRRTWITLPLLLHLPRKNLVHKTFSLLCSKAKLFHWLISIMSGGGLIRLRVYTLAFQNFLH